jgi:hypothetical protein
MPRAARILPLQGVRRILVHLYLSVAHRTGSAEAVDLADQLSAWHDEMVVHARAVARDGRSRCGEACPHARAVELWRAAREVLGSEESARLTFLKEAASSRSTARPAGRRTLDAGR